MKTKRCPNCGKTKNVSLSPAITGFEHKGRGKYAGVCKKCVELGGPPEFNEDLMALDDMTEDLFQTFLLKLTDSFGHYLPKLSQTHLPKILESLEIQNPDHAATTKVVLTLRYDKQPRQTSERNLRRLGFTEILTGVYEHPELIDKGWYVVNEPTQGGFVVRPSDIADPDAQYPKVPTISDLFRFCEFIGVDLNPDKLNLSTLLLS